MTNDDNMKTVIMKRFSRSPSDRELPSCPDTGAGWTILGHNVALKSGLKIDTSTVCLVADQRVQGAFVSKHYKYCVPFVHNQF